MSPTLSLDCDMERCCNMVPCQPDCTSTRVIPCPSGFPPKCAFTCWSHQTGLRLHLGANCSTFYGLTRPTKCIGVVDFYTIVCLFWHIGKWTETSSAWSKALNEVQHGDRIWHQAGNRILRQTTHQRSQRSIKKHQRRPSETWNTMAF